MPPPEPDAGARRLTVHVVLPQGVTLRRSGRGRGGYSDSTEYSRPILERSGLLRVSTTTPYRWSR